MLQSLIVIGAVVLLAQSALAKAYVTDVAVSSTGLVAISVSERNSGMGETLFVRVVDSSSDRVVQTFPNASMAHFVMDGHRLAALREPNHIVAWDTTTWKEVSSCELPRLRHAGAKSSYANHVSPIGYVERFEMLDQHRVAYAYRASPLTIWDEKNRELFYTKDYINAYQSLMLMRTSASAERTIVAAFLIDELDGELDRPRYQIAVRSADDLRNMGDFVFERKGVFVEDIAIVPNGKVGVILGFDAQRKRALCLAWTIENGPETLTKIWAGEQRRTPLTVRPLQLSSDSKYLAIVSDKEVNIISIQDRKLLRTLSNSHRRFVTATFVPGTTSLVTVNDELKIRVCRDWFDKE